jgi:hypothetical protein
LRALRPFLFASSSDIHDALSTENGVVPLQQQQQQQQQQQTEADHPSTQTDKALLARQQLRQNLSHLRPCDVLHHIISRLPRECAMPHSRNKMEISTYSEAMDAAAASAAATATSLGVDSTFAQARARLAPSQRALNDIDLYVAKGASACVDIDFVARAAVTGGPAASSFIEVSIVRVLCAAKAVS